MVRGVHFSDRQYVKRATRLIDLDQEALKVPANQAAAQMDSDLKACFQLFFTLHLHGCGMRSLYRSSEKIEEKEHIVTTTRDRSHV